MKKTLTGLVLGAMISAGIVACAVDDDSAESETEQALGITYVTYYNNAAHSVVVGHCRFQVCIPGPKGTVCDGHKTQWFTSEADSCN